MHHSCQASKIVLWLFQKILQSQLLQRRTPHCNPSPLKFAPQFFQNKHVITQSDVRRLKPCQKSKWCISIPIDHSKLKLKILCNQVDFLWTMPRKLIKVIALMLEKFHTCFCTKLCWKKSMCEKKKSVTCLCTCNGSELCCLWHQQIFLSSFQSDRPLTLPVSENELQLCKTAFINGSLAPILTIQNHDCFNHWQSCDSGCILSTVWMVRDGIRRIEIPLLTQPRVSSHYYALNY